MLLRLLLLLILPTPTYPQTLSLLSPTSVLPTPFFHLSLKYTLPHNASLDLVLCDTITITSNYHIEEDRNVIMQCHTRAQGVATSHIPEEFMSSMADWKGSFGYEGIYNDEVRGMYAKIVDISPYLPASDYHGAITVDIWATISLYDSNQPGKVKLLAEVGTTLILTGLTEVQSTTSFVSLSNFPQPLIIDTFTYMDNPAMLYLRLATHNATVDLFVIIEGSTTHTGNPSPSNIHSDYWGYGDKVVHKTVNFDAVMHDTDTADGDTADSGSKARERILRDVSALQRLPNNCVPSPAVANTPTYQTRRSEHPHVPNPPLTRHLPPPSGHRPPSRCSPRDALPRPSALVRVRANKRLGRDSLPVHSLINRRYHVATQLHPVTQPATVAPLHVGLPRRTLLQRDGRESIVGYHREGGGGRGEKGQVGKRRDDVAKVY